MQTNRIFRRVGSTAVAVGCITYLATSIAVHAVTVYSSVAVDGAGILPTVNAFRADLGANNGVGPLGVGGTPGVGRREINWDAVPDAFSAGGSNPFPGNFFNLATGGPAARIRGASFTTTGSFVVSADADSDNNGVPGPVDPEFGNFNPANLDDFAAFSAERIFGLLGTSTMEVSFSIPGSPSTPAAVRGFGAVFTDVELDNSTSLTFFDVGGANLGSYFALPIPPPPGPRGFIPPLGEIDLKGSFSFLGVTFVDPIVAKVVIKSGDTDLTVNHLKPIDGDSVAMDDFIYGEPAAAARSVPEGGSGLCFLGLSFVGLLGLRKYRGRK